MGNKLYVGNLAYSIRDEDLQQAFAQYGTVTSAKVMMDRDTGRSKGFGFVEMASDAEAQAGINGMNGQALDLTKTAEIVKLIDAQDIARLKSAILADREDVPARARRERRLRRTRVCAARAARPPRSRSVSPMRR